MGYTHYFKSKRDAESKAGYLKAAPIIAKIVKRYEDILQYECDDNRKPVVNETMVRFNGIGEDGHETFLFQLGGNDFCKTARKDYDIAVCECLLVLKAFIPSMYLGSDGFYAVDKDGLDGTWDAALENVATQYGIRFTKKFAKRKEGGYIDLLDLKVAANEEKVNV